MDATLVLFLTSISVAASITWAVKLLNWLWLRPRKLEKLLRKQGLNGNSYRPFLGDLKNFVGAMKAEEARSIKLSDNILPHIYPYHQTELSKYGGHNSLMWYGPIPGLITGDPELIKEILKKPEAFPKPCQDVVEIIASGLLSLEGEKWAKRRKIINPAFHLHKIKYMVPAIGLSCRNVIIQTWKSMVCSSEKGLSEIDIWPYIQDLSGDIITRILFGSSYEEGRRIFQLQREKSKLIPQLFQFAFIPGWRKTKAMIEEMQSLLRGIIEKRQNAMERGEEIGMDDLVSTLLEPNAKVGVGGRGMSIEDVVEECKGFYSAGTETASSLLAWTMVLLCKHPEWQIQARQEVIRVFGNSQPTFEGLNHLEIMTMILQEVLRLYPPVPLTVRKVTETVKLQSITLPAGVYFTILIGMLHYDTKIWGEDAAEFKPQRFSQGISSNIQSSFMPFSSGPRACVGRNLGMIEAKMAITMILQHFSFLLSPSYLHAPFASLTLKPQYGVTMIFRNLE